MSFPEARDRLQQKIKDDNSEIQKLDKRLKECQKIIDSNEKKLKEMVKVFVGSKHLQLLFIDANLNLSQM